MIWDLPNLLVCLLAIMTAYLLGKIKATHAICLAVLSLVPYCLNYVLFDPAYMPDQFTYWHILSAIRDGSYNSNYYNKNVTEAAYLYAFLPLPFVETVNSLGFFNKFLMILIFIWVSAVHQLRGWLLWFLLLYPSLILYSSLGFRDMLICTVMLLTFWTLIRGWYLLTLICLGVLLQIKMQNALLVAVFSLCYLADKFGNFQFQRKKIFSIVLILFMSTYLVFPFMIAKIEYYRQTMFLENGGILSEYQSIKNFFDFVYQGAFGIVRAIFYPLPWASKGSFHLMQSFENIAIALVLLVFTVSSYRIIPKQTVMWLFFLLSGLFMYGLVVSNIGTMVRYKLPFIVVYFIFLSYERVLYQQKLAGLQSPTVA